MQRFCQVTRGSPLCILGRKHVVSAGPFKCNTPPHRHIYNIDGLSTTEFLLI